MWWFVLISVPLGAQPVADLISQELTWGSDERCFQGTPVPRVPSFTQTVPRGQPFAPPYYSNCNYVWPSGSSALSQFRFQRINLTSPDRTPPARTETLPNGSIRVNFTAPLSLKLDAAAAWLARSPTPGDPVASGTLSYQVQAETGQTALCQGEVRSLSGDNPAQTADCSIPGLPAQALPDGGVSIVLLTTVTFRFGAGNGIHSWVVRSTYQLPYHDIDHAEFVQVVRTSGNAVPLVARKSTILRVFPVADRITDLSLAFEGFRDGVPLGKRWGGIVTAIPRSQVDRASGAAGASLSLPSSWAGAGTLTVRVDLHGADGQMVARKEFTARFTEAGARPYSIAIVRFCEVPLGGGEVLCAQIPQRSPGWLLQKVFPASAAVEREIASVSYFVDTSSENAAKAASAERQVRLALQRIRLALDGSPAVAPYDLVLGLTPAGGALGQYGGADEVSPARYRKIAITSDDALAPARTACLAAANWGVGSGPSAAIGDTGYDALEGIEIPAGTLDLTRQDCRSGVTPGMWVSADSFRRLLDYRLGAPPRAAGVRDLIVISGSVAPDGSSATLEKGFRQASSLLPIPSDPNASTCLLFSGEEGVLGDYCFGMPAAGGDFVVSAPAPVGTQRVALYRDGAEVAFFTVSAAAPVARFTTLPPTMIGGEPLTLQWSGSDADGDALSYTLYASTDNRQSLIPLSFSTTETAYVADPNRMVGANLIFVIAASDGWNTASAQAGPLRVNQTPRLEFPSLEYTFADVAAGRSNTAVVVVRNAGASPAVVTGITGGTEVFQPAAFTAPLELLGGESREVYFRFAPAAADAAGLGSHAGSVTLQSNDPRSPASLQLRGRSVNRAGPSFGLSSRFLDFGSVEAGQTIERTLTLVNEGSEPLVLRSFQIDNPAFVPGDTAAEIRLSPGASQVLPVRFRNGQGGYFQGALTASSNDPARRQIRIPLAAAVMSGAIEVLTPEVDLGTVATGQNATSRVLIRNSGLAALPVTALATDNRAFTVTTPGSFRLDPLTWRDIDLRFTPVVPGPQAAKLTITATGLDPAPVSLKAAGLGAPLPFPRIQASLASLDFGDIATGLNSVQIVTLRNVGAVALTISQLASSHARFTILSPGTPITLLPDSGTNVLIRFAPNATGVLTAVLTVTSNDPTTPTLTVELKGNGTIAPSSCTYRIGPPSVQAAATAWTEGLNVNTQPGCPWTAESRTSWIRVESNLKGSGHGTVGIAVEANPQATERSGAVQIENQTVAVTQAAAGTTGRRTVVLRVDDGTYRFTIGLFRRDVYFANRLTPPKYPATLKGIQIHFPENGMPQGSPMTLFWAELAGGAVTGGKFGPVPLRSAPTQVPAPNEYIEFPAGPLTITSGDFVVGYQVSNPLNIRPALINSTNVSIQRSFISTDGVNFALTGNLALTPGNLAIRAVVEIEQ